MGLNLDTFYILYTSSQIIIILCCLAEVLIHALPNLQNSPFHLVLDKDVGYKLYQLQIKFEKVQLHSF